MFDGKLLITTLVGMIVASAAYCHFSANKNETRENWWGTPSRTWKVDRMVARDHKAAQKGDFVSIPNFQAILEPRFHNSNVGAAIRYNPPSEEFMASPCNPLTFAAQGSGQATAETFTQDAREDFCGSCSGVADCGRGGAQPPAQLGAPLTEPSYATGNYNEVLDAAYGSESTLPAATANVPVGDMTVVDAMGQTTQPIVYDRYIYANRNSRLRSQGDWIRGDLAIVPCAAEWFRPSVHPHIDLNQGAMNVLGGADNGTAMATAQLIYQSSGNADTTIGGANIATELAGASGMDGTVQISAFA